MTPQLWRDVLVLRQYQGWRRALGWALNDVWTRLRWGIRK